MKTAELYRQNFGAAVSVRDFGDGRILVNVRLGGVDIKISKVADDVQTGLTHFGLRTSDLAAEAGKLKNNGITFTSEVQGGISRAKVAFLAAPEDVSVELMEGTAYLNLG